MSDSRVGRQPGTTPGAKMDLSRFFLIALSVICSVYSDGSFFQPSNALDTMLTSTPTPSFAQELLSFSAMNDVAEREHLNWGTGASLQRGGGAESSVRAARAAKLLQHGAAAGSSAPLTRSASRTSSEEPSVGAHSRDGEFGVASSAESSGEKGEEGREGDNIASARPHRRPHRRQRHRTKGHTTATSSLVDDGPSSGSHNSGALSSSASSSIHRGGAERDVGAMDPVLLRLQGSQHLGLSSTRRRSIVQRMWTQLHVPEVAYSTKNNNFVHITERLVEYHRMYPTIYRCELEDFSAPQEEALLHAPQAGLESSRHWQCTQCGFLHDRVRQDCRQCGHDGPYARLFVGQTMKEVNTSRSLIRLLHATHEGVGLHRVKVHKGRGGRGKGCASVYMLRDDADHARRMLHKNVFFDIRSDDGKLVAYYVYEGQRPWLDAFVSMRTTERTAAGGDQGDGAAYLPWSSLVVEN